MSDSEKSYKKWQLTGVIFLSLLIVLFSCLSKKTFNVYYVSTLNFLSLDKSSTAAYLLAHPDLGHVIAYSLLTLLLFSPLKTWNIVIPPFLAFSFGLLMEATQLLLPSRGSSWSDVGWNILGISAGTSLWFLLDVFKRVVAKSVKDMI